MRAVTAADAALLEDMMLVAGFAPGRPLPADARQQPHVRAFVEHWGRPGDVGVVALDAAGAPVGAAWARVLDDLAPLPELAIAVVPEARGAGVGATLLDTLAAAAARAGHPALALRVSRRNTRALALYRRAGFEEIGDDRERVVMERSLRTGG
jgi:ribosomal protein S18 acetylase RimI-like enzyme